MEHNKFVTAILLALCAAPVSYADSTLVYELTNKDGDKVAHTIQISGRWLRLESQPKGKADYTVMDMGRMLKLEVDDKTQSFQLTRMGRLYWPETALNSPKFKPIAKKNAVAGVPCQPVNEMGNGKEPSAEHCMSSGGSLKLNAREMITLSRLFMSVRRMSDNLGDSWLGVATPDERQVSVLSHTTDGDKLVLKSVSHGRIDKTLLKMPVDYKQQKPDLPIKEDKKAQQQPAEIPQAAGQQEQPESEAKRETGQPRTSE
jgi:hypothetical protein